MADETLLSIAKSALAARTDLPGTIHVAVDDGCITLTGDVAWPFHRVAAGLAVHGIPGAKSVINQIRVAPLASYVDVRHRVAMALQGITHVNARHVGIAIRGATVTLTGHVATQAQRNAVENAAAAAPGITSVANLIEVRQAA